MNILITGANGVLAFPIIKKLSKNNFQLILTDKVFDNSIDFVGNLKDNNFVEELIEKNSIDVIIHLAANTNVDLCEREKYVAYADNFLSTKNLVDNIKTKEIFFIFISTASVFDGEKEGGYSENDIPSPLNYYARTKLMAENYIQKKLKNYTITRLGWLIGHPRKVNKFMKFALDKINEKPTEIFAVNDIKGSLTFATDFAEMLLKFLMNPTIGVFNFASRGKASRYEILNFMIEYLNLKDSIKLKPVPNSFFKLIAPRPKNEILLTNKMDELALFSNDFWQNKLLDFLNEFQNM
jgi:dTDP-4-dehydrorhamnose reductase